MVNIFLTIPESNPTHLWIKSNQDFQEENRIITFVRELHTKVNSIRLENFDGYYDSENIRNFLSDFEDVAEYYPNPAFRQLRMILKNWINWCENREHDQKETYFIYNQTVTNHSFCECCHRSVNNPEMKFLILNHYGHAIGDQISISINNSFSKTFKSVSTIKELRKWFSVERYPARNFQVIPKHGENRQNERVINGELISPLRCSQEEAQILLNSAIGDQLDELFNLDNEYYIIFKFEGANPQNMYHGYHVPITSTEIPPHIKDELRGL